MKVRPIQRIYHTFDKDERQEAEEKRIRALLNLLCEMNIPDSKIKFLKLKPERAETLKWLKTNLAVNNSHHKNYKQAYNLINLLTRTTGKP